MHTSSVNNIVKIASHKARRVLGAQENVRPDKVCRVLGATQEQLARTKALNVLGASEEDLYASAASMSS